MFRGNSISEEDDDVNDTRQQAWAGMSDLVRLGSDAGLFQLPAGDDPVPT